MEMNFDDGCPLRVKHFYWRVMNNLIAKEENLKKHHVPTIRICDQCAKHWGGTTHYLIFCGHVNHVWKVTSYWVGLKTLAHHIMEDLCRQIFSRWGKRGLEQCFVRLWLVWKAICE